MQLIKLWETDLPKAYNLYQTFEEDENGFLNEAYGLDFDQFKLFVEMVERNSNGEDLPHGYVPWTIYILEDNKHYVGIFKLRHHLNEYLAEGAGHIGFGVAKLYRNQGYASKGLRLMVDIAKTVIPEDEIYMACYKYNQASLKAQLSNGAYIHHEDEDHYYTRIKK